MKRFSHHIIKLASACCLIAAAPACSTREAGLADEPQRDEGRVRLGLTAEILGEARSGEAAGLPDN